MMRKRFAVFGVLALVLALLMPSRAFGWDLIGDGVWWRGSTSEGMYGACVHADNKYDAAAWLFSPGDPAMLSSEVRTKLSDPNYGGRFYEYAQTFSFMEDLTQYPEWLPAYVGVANLFVNGFGVGIFDVGFYTSNVSESLYAGAKIDFQRVLAGEDLSGGSGGTVVPDGDFSIYALTSFATRYDNGYVGNLNFYNAYGADYSGGVVTLTGQRRRISPYANSSYYFPSSRGYFSSSVINFANDLLLRGYDVMFWAGITGNKVNEEWSSTFGGVVYGHDLTMGTYHGVSGDGYGYSNTRVYGSDLHRVTFDDVSVFYYDSASPFIFVDGDVSVSQDISSPAAIQCFASIVYEPFSPLPPGGDWPEPETPVTPDPPEVPTPTAPTVTPDPEPTQPTPTWPDITINIPGAPTVETTPTGLDYTELLTRINDNLNTINSYTVSINSGLNSLRSDLVTEFESVEQALRNIYQFLQHLDTMLERHCQHLRDALSDCTHHFELYMKELFEWLPQQLNYDAEFSYDDSAVTSLLRAILNKIPGGSSGIPDTFKPNPQADEPGFFDWLTDLWHRFLIDLVSVLPDEIGGLVDAFSQLTHYFPFSIPWDLAAMLALFEHEPVTPVFDVPWGFGGNEGDVEMIRVDLSPWDGVMQMVRPVFVVGFCWQLALITKDLLAGFDLNKGGV